MREREEKKVLPDAEVRERVIGERGHIFLSAGAGAGKSTTLVLKILSLLEKGLVPEMASIAAITFTRKAAAELKWKLEAMLKKRVGEVGDEKVRGRLEDALANLEEAPIGTIHSFCGDLLRRFGVYLEIDPNFMIADEVRSESLFRDFIEEYVRNFWPATAIAVPDGSDSPDSPGGSSIQDGDINEVWRQVFELDPKVNLESIEERLRLFNENGDLLDELNFESGALADGGFPIRSPEELRDQIEAHFLDHRERFVGLASLYDYEGEAAKDPEGSSLGSALGECVALLQGSAGWEEWRLHKESLRPPKGRGKKGFLREAVGGLEESESVALIRSYMTYLARDKGEALEKWRGEAWFQELFSSSPIEGVGPLSAHNLRAELERYLWARAGSHFVRLFRGYKRSLGILDYADLIHYTLQLVQNPETLAQIRGMIGALFVDEYQDTDPVQTNIFNAICGIMPGAAPQGAPPLFRVGDEKQSIYLFRGADLRTYDREKELFAKALHDPEEAGGKGGMQRYLGDLTANMRSAPRVVECVNALFSDGREGGGNPLAIPGYRDMAPVRSAVEGEGVYFPTVYDEEVEKPDSRRGRQMEALWMAAEIRSILDEAASDAAKGLGGRPPTIGILFYTLNHIRPYIDTFLEYGIEARVAGRKYFGENELRRYVTLLLRLVLSPHDLTCAAGFLRSPFGGLSDAQLDTLFGSLLPAASRALGRPLRSLLEWPYIFGGGRVEGKVGDGDDGEKEVVERALHFSQFLSSLYDDARRRPLAYLILQIAEGYDLFNIAPGGYDAEMFRETIYSIYDKAIRLDMQGGVSTAEKLRQIIETLEGHENVNTQVRGEEAPGADSSHVQIMSYHKSKGLEFDIVFLGDLAYGFQNRGLSLFVERTEGDPARSDVEFPTAKPDVEFHTDTEFHNRPTEQPHRWNIYNKDDLSHLQWRAQNPSRERERKYDAEKVRLLYVAMTRARDRLYLPMILSNRTSSTSFQSRLVTSLQSRFGYHPFDQSDDPAPQNKFAPKGPIFAGRFSLADTAAKKDDPLRPIASPQYPEAETEAHTSSIALAGEGAPREYSFFSGSSLLKKINAEKGKTPSPDSPLLQKPSEISEETGLEETSADETSMGDKRGGEPIAGQTRGCQTDVGQTKNRAPLLEPVTSWQGLDALEIGTIAHLIFEWIDLKEPAWSPDISLAALSARRLPHSLMEPLNRYAATLIESYKKSPLYELAKRSHTAGKELSFSWMPKPQVAPHGTPQGARQGGGDAQTFNPKIAVGYIDLLLQEQQGEGELYHIVDYKTNRIDDSPQHLEEGLRRLLEGYQIPMKIYYLALKETYPEAQVKMALYHVPTGRLLYYPDPAALPGPETWPIYG